MNERYDVVHCKDCAYRDEPLEGCCSVYRIKQDGCPFDFVKTDYDFCSWGVRKESE